MILRQALAALRSAQQARPARPLKAATSTAKD